MCDHTWLNQKKCLTLVFCLFPLVPFLERKEKEISSSIPSTKPAKEEGGDIVAKNVERHSHPHMERHIIDYSNQKPPSTMSQQ